MKRILVALIAAVATVGVAALLVSIIEKRSEERQYPLLLTKLDDDSVSPSVWGANFPRQLERYLMMAQPGAATAFGGGDPYSKLIRNPSLTRLWAGYPFSVDFNEERSHYYAAVDQLETKRNDRVWLNAHGFPNFKGQPGACMSCHSGWAPSLIRELGWETFNKTPYDELKALLIKQHGEGADGGHALGSTCADCHSPRDMRLRVTRPAYINAMVARGYTADPERGIVATEQEMRSHVCQQCHVEYYFKGDGKLLTFPWQTWPKGEAFRIEMLEAYYDAERAKDGFKADWTHAESGAAMLKVQHPETELYASSVHADAGVACADCHMPYRREGALKVSDHALVSPLLDVRGACQTCHPGEEMRLTERVSRIQGDTAGQLRAAEGAILALVDDIKRAQVAKGSETTLAKAREAHRRASLRWDFVASENSTGFHSPQEAARVLAQATEIARRGQLELVGALAATGTVFSPTAGDGAIPEPGPPIADRLGAVGGKPPPQLLDLDRRLQEQAQHR